MKKGRPEVNPEKIQAVDDLAKLINSYDVVGILNLYKTPASVLQITKTNLKGKALIKVTKKNILLRALDKADKQSLKEFTEGYPALILTKEDPFKIYNFLQKRKVSAPAKPGDIPEEDIEIKAGPTDLMPGPAISSLSKVKIAAKVEGGKIAVIRDKVVVKAGEKISLDLASALQLLKLKPMEIGLNVVVLEEKGILYKGEQLFVDGKKLLNDIQLAIQNAFNLSINADFPTKETIVFMLAKAQINAKQLESELNMEKKEVVKEESKEEKPSEQPKEEPKQEEKNPEEKEQKETKEETKPEEQKTEETKNGA